MQTTCGSPGTGFGGRLRSKRMGQLGNGSALGRQARCSGSEPNTQTPSSRRFDPLEQPQACCRTRRGVVLGCPTHLAQERRAPASARYPHGLQRPRLRDQGGRRDRPVPGPTRARGRVLCGREDGDPGTAPEGPDAASVARARRKPRLRIQTQRHVEPVRRAQHQQRRSAGQDRCAPHTSSS